MLSGESVSTIVTTCQDGDFIREGTDTEAVDQSAMSCQEKMVPKIERKAGYSLKRLIIKLFLSNKGSLMTEPRLLLPVFLTEQFLYLFVFVPYSIAFFFTRFGLCR